MNIGVTPQTSYLIRQSDSLPKLLSHISCLYSNTLPKQKQPDCKNGARAALYQVISHQKL